MTCLRAAAYRSLLALILLAPTGPATTLRADVLISEFMASNSRTLLDEDGDSSDWIELFNDGTTAVNLDGWFLSNSRGDPTQWRFPEVTVPAQQHLLVFASGKDRTTVGRPLHTGFKLASDGDYLALIQPDGHTVATEFEPQYPVQVTDVSFGIPVKQTVTTLVAAGAVGKLLVPNLEPGAIGWATPEFDDSGWSNVATGVGFEVVANSPEPGVIADSEAQFTGTQGNGRWFYGYYDRTGDANGVYQLGDFQTFANEGGPHSPGNFFDGTSWRWFKGPPPFTEIGATRMRPNGSATGTEQWPVRRWLSTVDGAVEVEWTLAKEIAGGSGVTGRVYQKGVQKDSLTLAGDDTTGATRKVSLIGLKVGDPVDFVVTPAGISDTKDATGDVVAFTARISAFASLDAQIKSGIADAMYGQNATAFLRLPFTVTDPSAFSLLSLRMKYDDGFVAYLNGVEVARANAADEVVWDSTATEAHADFDSSRFEEFDLTRRIGLLHPGENVLAIQGLNFSADDDDFLILPELVATGTDLDKSARRYFSLPTPGAANGEGNTHLGPLILEVAHTPDAPEDDQDLVVTARVAPTFEAVAGATLNYVVMYGTVASVPMADDGAHGDGASGDGIFGGTIPAAASGPGQMVRYFVSATDLSGDVSRWPAFVDKKKSPEYLGTVVKDPKLTNHLPVFHWFIKTPSTADGAGSRCSVYFNGEFYDNVFANLHGQSSQSFPKHSYNFDMNPQARFRYDDSGRRVDDFNLLTTYPDKAHIRNMLAYETHRDAGCAYHVVIPMRIQQNGKFWGDAHWVEDGDEFYLDRLGLDPRGALYKMYNTFDSASGAEKKTRKWENSSDLQGFITGIAKAGANRRAFLYDNVNLPAMINYLAVMPITANIDCCHKNYYAYRDSEGTGEWTFLPWDQDLSFGRNWTGSLAYFDDTVYFQNPLYVGDNNTLISAIFAEPALKQMYLRRVRTLMDQLLQPTNTPPELRYYEHRIAQLSDAIEPDAAIDFAKWPTWGKKMTMPQSVAQLLTNYFPKRRKFLFVDQVTPRGAIPTAQPAGAVINFGAFDVNPASGDQDQEYVELKNPNNYAVDVSGWEVTGDIQHTLAPGTVLPANGRLFLTRRTKAFRSRTTAPTGGQGLFVQGGYHGQMTARGGVLHLMDGAREVSSLTLPAMPGPAQKFLRVSELMFAPAATSADGPFEAGEFEFLELQNTGPAPLEMAGIRIAGGITFDFTTSPLKQLGPGGFAVLARNAAAFHSRYGTGVGIAGAYGGRLDNAGESLRVEDEGEVVLDFDYDPRWLPLAAGGGYSIEVIDPGADWKSWSARSQWRLSSVVGGTPGQSDEDFKLWRKQHFNAIELLDPSISGSAADPDQDGSGNLHEFGAGTDPRDPSSLLRLAVHAPPAADGPLQLGFHAIAGRTYSVQFQDPAGVRPWTKLANIPAQAADREVTVPDPDANIPEARLYRVVTPAAP